MWQDNGTAQDSWRCVIGPVAEPSNHSMYNMQYKTANVNRILPLKALSSLYCADVPLINYSLTRLKL